jgi:hypothetical protein
MAKYFVKKAVKLQIMETFVIGKLTLDAHTPNNEAYLYGTGPYVKPDNVSTNVSELQIYKVHCDLGHIAIIAPNANRAILQADLFRKTKKETDITVLTPIFRHYDQHGVLRKKIAERKPSTNQQPNQEPQSPWPSIEVNERVQVEVIKRIHLCENHDHTVNYLVDDVGAHLSLYLITRETSLVSYAVFAEDEADAKETVFEYLSSQLPDCVRPAAPHFLPPEKIILGFAGRGTTTI